MAADKILFGMYAASVIILFFTVIYLVVIGSFIFTLYLIPLYLAEAQTIEYAKKIDRKG